MATLLWVPEGAEIARPEQLAAKWVWPRLCALFFITPAVWITLAIGLFWVTFSYLIQFKFASSGAVLISSCVIGEMILLNYQWRTFPEKSGRNVYVWQKGSYYYSDEGQFNFFQSHDKEDNIRRLHSLSMYSHFELARSEKTKELIHPTIECWNISKTISYIDRIFLFVFGGLILIGTFIWAYSPVHISEHHHNNPFGISSNKIPNL